ncbi:TPA: hypothetical protein PZ808_003026, partial [Staphylococcus aureus]|nr:hypothetical protein [Staphylococcus aureus]
MMLWIAFILFGIAVLLLTSYRRSKIENYFPETEVDEDIIAAINLNALMEQKRWQRFKNNLSPAIKVLGPRANFIIFVFIVLSGYLSYYIIYELLNINSILISIGVFTFSVVWGYYWLQNKRRLDFE